MSGNEIKREFGDYQTPQYFAELVCNYIKVNLGINPKIILEPTCGIGNFINASFKTFKSLKKAIGIEINSRYVEECKNNINNKNVEILNEDIFNVSLEETIKISDDNILIIGNPPWVTNSDLKFNLPNKINFKEFSGIDAITGASNFDISEYIILKIIREFNGTNNIISMLCKTSVARNVLLELSRNEIATDYIKILEFDANKTFNVGASACVLIIKLSNENKYNYNCEVVNINNPNRVKDVWVCKNGNILSEVHNAEDFEGICEFEWRQGVKHDCAGIMELTKNVDGSYTNKNKDIIDIEDTFVFPLMKSSSFKQPIIKNNFKKYVIVTQRKARQETSSIEFLAPKTWSYLNMNKEYFDKRKSSIYKGAPTFSMFGVGDYSYAPYKVGVSGFYKKALFCLTYNEDEIIRPVMGDDTSYFLAFSDKETAYLCMVLLNNDRVQQFLVSISFKDAKRPYTKKVLSRISLKKCIQVITINELQETENKLGLTNIITDKLYNNFKEKLYSHQISFFN